MTTIQQHNCYKNGEKIKQISAGGDEIRRVYKGNQLVWEKQYYTPGQIIFEQKTPGSYSFEIKDSGYYEVIFIGAGGGSSGSGGGGGHSDYSAGVVSGEEGS